jgi:hypothetical protein
MKNTFTILFLFFFAATQAQELEYKISKQAGDTTFVLDVIELENPNFKTIKRTSGLKEQDLQKKQNLKIEKLYDLIARSEAKILDHRRNISAIKQSLDSLDNFSLYQKIKFDSSFVYNYRYRNTNRPNTTLSSTYRAENTTLLKDDDNVNVAVIIPFSLYYIRLRFVNPDYQDGDEVIDLYSKDQRIYTGVDSQGIRHTLVKF